jgi:hypothetical protein
MLRFYVVNSPPKTFDHVPDVLDFVRLGLQSIDLGNYTPHSNDLRVCVLYHVPCTIVACLDRILCSILQLSASLSVEELCIHQPTHHIYTIPNPSHQMVKVGIELS